MSQKKRQSIIYIYPNKSSFIQNDIDFLQKNYTIKTQDLPWANALKLPLNLVKQFFFLGLNVKSSKAIIVSFGGYFSLLPVLFGKLFGVSSLIILNGTDCVSFPTYNYGSLRKYVLKFFIKKTQQYATKLIPVDSSLIQQVHTFDKNALYKNQGYKSFFSKIKTPAVVIPNGFDTSFWNYTNDFLKEKSFISVVSASFKTTLKIKGIDLILDVATNFLDSNFVLVGISDELKSNIKNIPNNVKIYPFLTKEKLKKLYQKNQFYVQLSINEGFGCALSEAMLCGCIPVVSNVGAMPNIVDKIGVLVKNRNKKEVENKFQKVLKFDKNQLSILSQKSRERIVANFDIFQREKLLLQEIENTI